jgi:uncharacterized protein (DUF4415 family)
MKRAKQSKNIKHGNVELGPEYLDPKNQKHRVTFWMDGDLKEELLRQANQVGAGYQTYMHKLLRDAVFKHESLTDRVEKLEKVLKNRPG